MIYISYTDKHCIGWAASLVRYTRRQEHRDDRLVQRQMRVNLSGLLQRPLRHPLPWVGDVRVYA